MENTFSVNIYLILEPNMCHLKQKKSTDELIKFHFKYLLYRNIF